MMKKLVLHIVLIIGLLMCWQAPLWAAKFTAAEGKVLNEASKLVDNKNYTGAVNLLSDYIQKNKPKQAEFYYLLGTAQYFRGQHSQAYDALLRSVEIDPKNSDAVYNLGNVAYELGRFAQAGKYLEQAYNMRGKDRTPEMCFATAAAYYQAKQYGNASRMAQKMIDNGSVFQKPSYVELCAVALMDNKQGPAAKKLMQEALNRNPANMRYWQILANVSLSQGDYVTLAMALEVSYALQPPKREKWLELANVYLYVNAQARALRCMQKAYGNTADVAALRRMYQTAMQAGLFERALNYLDTAINNSAGAEKAKLCAEKGFALYDRGLWSRAVESFRTCLASDTAGAHAEALLFIGYAQLELNQVEAAKQTFKRGSEMEKIKSYSISMLDMLNELYPVPGAETVPEQ